jgi:protein disulfide-isomerase A6
LAPTKLDELKIKANILSAFAAKKVEEYAEAAGEAAQDAYETVKETVEKATDRVKEEL